MTQSRRGCGCVRGGLGGVSPLGVRRGGAPIVPAHSGPPLQLSAAAYAGLGAELAAMRLPVLAVLEGGYATHVLGPCLEALAAPFAAPPSVAASA